MQRILDLLRKRKIKSVGSWDGSAANYSTVEAYARASLINFNPAAGNTSPDTWVKELIKLPVRNEGDSSDTFIKEAIQAAAGGRGITRVKKPDNVSSEDYHRILQDAANKIISAYTEWEGIAPDSVYRVAKKDAPVERAVTFQKIYQDVLHLLTLADYAEGTLTILYDVYYDDTQGRFFALCLRDGIVYNAEIIVQSNSIMLGDFTEITAQDLIPRSSSSLKVYRSKNGDMRWLAISSVACINRLGEIDSTQLFDSFIDFANVTGLFPGVTVYHLGTRTTIGKADLLARRGYVYITSGKFYDNEDGRAFYNALKDRDDWGNSIEFYSPGLEVETIEWQGRSIQVPMHKHGINTDITLVQERHAASVLTVHKSL